MAVNLVLIVDTKLFPEGTNETTVPVEQFLRLTLPLAAVAVDCCP